ncbi:hypothetical protein QPK87_04815 [Kamptonema cortianum]|nr:hypothetical protein [Geitlerinema splendidum]MDK3155898.1 hypothetical protein [Kamptonema cortianum]
MTIDLESLLTGFEAADETVDIEFEGKGVWKFCPPNRYGDLRWLRSASRGFVEAWRRQSSPGGLWEEFADLTESEVAAAFLMSELSKEPVVGQLDALRLVRSAGPVVDQILRTLDTWGME